MDKASQVLIYSVSFNIYRLFCALADYGSVTRTTLQHCIGGRQLIEEKA